jgi:valyl-tRNA synthetase
VTEALEGFQYGEAARLLYGFAWDDFCSFYLEMVKGRLQAAASRPAAQRLLAHALDTLLRLLHPMIPFLTEEVWQLLGESAPRRGIDAIRAAEPSVMIAPWPASDPRRRDPEIEARFSRFQEVLRAVREVRNRQNVPPGRPIEFAVRCDASTAALLEPMRGSFISMAAARPTQFGPEVLSPALVAGVTLPGMEVLVDLAGLIDVAAERAKKREEKAKIEARIASQEKKLANESFVQRAPAAVVEKEREALRALQEQHAATVAALERLAAGVP